MEGVLGPLDRSIVVDEFTYDQVKGAECLGQVRRYLTVQICNPVGRYAKEFAGR